MGRTIPSSIAINASVHFAIPIEIILSSVGELRVMFAEAMNISVERVIIHTIAPGSTVVGFAVLGEKNEGHVLSGRLHRAVNNEQHSLSTIFHIIASSLVMIFQEEYMPFWIFVAIPIVTASTALGAGIVVRRVSRGGRLETSLYRCPVIDVAVRNGRLFVDGEAIINDDEFYKHKAFVGEEDEEDHFRNAATMLSFQFRRNGCGTPEVTDCGSDEEEGENRMMYGTKATSSGSGSGSRSDIAWAAGRWSQILSTSPNASSRPTSSGSSKSSIIPWGPPILPQTAPDNCAFVSSTFIVSMQPIDDDDREKKRLLSHSQFSISHSTSPDTNTSN